MKKTICIAAVITACFVIAIFAGSGEDRKAIRSQRLHTSQALVPDVLNYQGVLADEAGSPLDATVDMTFSLYDSESSGIPLYTEIHTVTVQNGLFDVQLNAEAIAPVAQGIIVNGGETYVGVTVGDDAEMTPRQRIGSVPFAHRVDGLHRDAEGNFGIGTTSPEAPLHVEGIFGPGGWDIVSKVEGVFYPGGWGGIVSKFAALSEEGVETGSVEVLKSNEYALGVFGPGGWGWAGYFDGRGYFSDDLGIGTAEPTEKLDVVGNGRFDGDLIVTGEIDPKALRFIPQTSAPLASEGKVYYNGSADELYVYDGSTWQPLIGGGGGADDDWRVVGGGDPTVSDDIYHSGHVGIGTSSPTAKLHVVTSGPGSPGKAVYGKSEIDGGTGVYGAASITAHNGVYGIHSPSGNSGLLGHGSYGAYGRSSGGNYGYLGGSDYGVYGYHSGSGNWGYIGQSTCGIFGINDGTGNFGWLGHNASGVRGYSPDGVAGRFSGDVEISGTLSKGAGSFKIDHPLDPENKYLSHSFVESPDMKNVYDGMVQLDANGEAWVELADWFEVLNKDFRYQLTCIGGFATVYVAEEISGNRFKIAGGNPGMKVSWQVTGIRQDRYANAHRIPVEEEKPPEDQSYYLHPDLYGKPEEKSVDWKYDQEILGEMQKAESGLRR